MCQCSTRSTCRAADPENAIQRDRGSDRHRRDQDATPCSAKTGLGVQDVIEAMIATRAGAQGRRRLHRCKRLIIDSWFDNYVGVVMLVRVVNGTPQAPRTRSC
ncbi:hypothetical protein ACU4GD_02770 [Cupriavidus basilensis]